MTRPRAWRVSSPRLPPRGRGMAWGGCPRPGRASCTVATMGAARRRPFSLPARPPVACEPEFYGGFPPVHAYERIPGASRPRTSSPERRTPKHAPSSSPTSKQATGRSRRRRCRGSRGTAKRKTHTRSRSAPSSFASRTRVALGARPATSNPTSSSSASLSSSARANTRSSRQGVVRCSDLRGAQSR